MNETGRNGKTQKNAKPNANSSDDNELAMNEIDIKQETGIKEEPDDGLILISLNAYDSLGDERIDGTDEFDHCFDSIEAKPDAKVKKEKENGSTASKDLCGSMSQYPKVINQKPKLRETGEHKIDSIKGRYQEKSEMAKNNKKSTVMKKHKCPTCEYATSVKTNLNTHMYRHTGEMPFSCSRCSKRFTQKKNLQQHMRMHVGEFAFSCIICLQGFNEESEKLAHEFNCTVRRFDCDFCKEFSTFDKKRLKEHMFVHSGKKPFKCGHCHMAFSIKQKLDRHMKAHINLRPLKIKCSIC